jgi:hypothetical protein
MRRCLYGVDTFSRWLWRMLRENLFFLLSIPLVGLVLLFVPQIETVVMEGVEVPFGENWQETVWAIGFMEFLVCMGAFSLASVFVVPTPQWVWGEKRYRWRLLPANTLSGHRGFILTAAAVFVVVAAVPLALNRSAMTDFVLTWIVTPIAVLVLAFVMARYLRIAANWLVWVAWKLGRTGRQTAIGVCFVLAAVFWVIVVWILQGGSYLLWGGAFRQLALWSLLTSIWFLLCCLPHRAAPRGLVMKAPGRVLGWLLFSGLIGQILWILATSDLPWLGVSYRLYTMWGVLQTATLIVVVGGMLDAWQRVTQWPMRFLGIAGLAGAFVLFWSAPEPLTTACEPAGKTTPGGSTVDANDWAERERWYNHLIDRLGALGPDDPAVIVTPSGGGSRAASFAALVLEDLSRTPLVSGKTWGDHIVMTSSVSGGSLANAYYLHSLSDPAGSWLQGRPTLRNSTKGELVLRMDAQANVLLLTAHDKVAQVLQDAGEPTDDAQWEAQWAELQTCLSTWSEQGLDDSSVQPCPKFKSSRMVRAWKDLGQGFEVWQFLRDYAKTRGGAAAAWVLSSPIADDMATDFMAPIVRGARSPGASRAGALRRFWTDRFGWHASNSRLGCDFRPNPPAREPNFVRDTRRQPLALFNTTDVGRGSRVVCGFPPVPPELLEASYPTTWPNNRSRPRALEEADPARTVALADAVSLSANFPWGFNVQTVPDRGKSRDRTNEDPILHLMDGGFVDNTGIDTVFEILRNIKRIAESKEKPFRPDEITPDDHAVKNCQKIMKLLALRRIVLLEIDSGAKPSEPGLITRRASLLLEPLMALNNAGYTGAELTKRNYIADLRSRFVQPVDLGDVKALLRQAPPGTDTRAWLHDLETTEAAGIPTFYHIQYICNHMDEGNVPTAWSLGPDDKARLLLRFLVERDVRRFDLAQFSDQDKVKIANIRQQIRRKAEETTERHLQIAGVMARYAELHKAAKELRDQAGMLAQKPTDEAVKKIVGDRVKEQQKSLADLRAEAGHITADGDLDKLKAQLDADEMELNKLASALAANASVAKAADDFTKKYSVSEEVGAGLIDVQRKNEADFKKAVVDVNVNQAQFDQRARQTREYFGTPKSKR